MYIYDDDLKYLLQLAEIFELFKKLRFFIEILSKRKTLEMEILLSKIKFIYNTVR